MSGRIVASTTLFALAHDVEPRTLEAITGLAIEELTRTDARFDNDIPAKLWRALCARHPNVALPLRMAEVTPLDYLGPLAHGVRFAASLRQALETFIRFRGILSDALETRLVKEQDVAALVTRHPSDALDAGAGAEVGLALGVRFVREVLGMPEALVAVELGHAARAPAADYASFFRVPVRFAAPRTALCFEPEALDRSRPRTEPRLFAYIEAHLQNAVDALTRSDGLMEIRDAVAKNAAIQEYGAKALASRLGLSLRALQREVSKHGTTVRALLDEARCAQAERLLQDRRLSVDEIAFVLSYSDERAFRRAFKRMKGESPAQFRRRQSLS